VGTNADWRACAPFWNSCTLLMKKDGSLWALDDVEDQRVKRLSNPAWKMKPVSLRRIPLGKDILAFAGGRHRLGVALTREGEVWTWGPALGRYSLATAPLQLLSKLLNQAGFPIRLGDPQPVVRKQPWQLPNEDPDRLAK
jgi:hypothetical protein